MMNKRLIAAACLLTCASSLALAQLATLGAGGVVPGGAPPAFEGVGDTAAGAGAVTYYGFRKYADAYSGEGMNICTPSDASCFDVGYSSDGSFDIAEATTAGCNDTTTICTIKTMYNMGSGGSSYDLTQATEGSRPRLVVNCQNGEPCGAGDASECLVTGTVSAIAMPWTMAIAFTSTATPVATRTIIGAAGEGLYVNTTPAVVGLGVTAATIANNTYNTAFAHRNVTTTDYVIVNGATTTGNGGNGNTGTPHSLFASSACLGVATRTLEGGTWAKAVISTDADAVRANIEAWWAF